jgi:hypothetical protein
MAEEVVVELEAVQQLLVVLEEELQEMLVQAQMLQEVKAAMEAAETAAQVVV